MNDTKNDTARVIDWARRNGVEVTERYIITTGLPQHWYQVIELAIGNQVVRLESMIKTGEFGDIKVPTWGYCANLLESWYKVSAHNVIRELNAMKAAENGRRG